MTGARDPHHRARRDVLDHLLALVATSACADELVLRGSVTMLAWFGERARDPGDVDWVVRPAAGVPLDAWHPYPYLDRLDPVQTWAEAAHGGARNQMWTFEEFDAGGARAYLPPDGLRWVYPEEIDPYGAHLRVADLLREHPETIGGVTVDVDGIVEDHDWTYAEYQETGYATGYDGPPGARLLVPWRLDAATSGTQQVDFAYDEPLPEPPVPTAVPRGDGRPATALWTASRGLSLAWKLRWLARDQELHGRGDGKDLYDAVLLAEAGAYLPGRRAGHAPPAETIRGWYVDPSGLPAGTAVAGWLDRLASALASSA